MSAQLPKPRVLVPGAVRDALLVVVDACEASRAKAARRLGLSLATMADALAMGGRVRPGTLEQIKASLSAWGAGR